MGWSIGLLLGESVVEMTACADISKPETCVQSRALMPNGSPEPALQSFAQTYGIDQIDSVHVVTQAPLHWVETALGTGAAILTTSGFENWLELNLPLKTRHLTSRPERLPFLIDSELVFGVSERTNAEGHIEKILDEQELEFLASKLGLHEIKHVALCFLHSNINAENEKRAVKYLTEKGFHVHTSSQHPSKDEKSRFWAAALNAYLTPLWHERLKQIQSGFEKCQTENTHWQAGTVTFQEHFDHKVGPLHAALSLTQHIGERFATTGAVLYCGLENLFFLPAGAGKKQVDWLGPVGAISIEHRPYAALHPEPLSKIGRTFFSEVSLLKESASFEPGPILMGRGLVPTLFDLLGGQQKEPTVTGITEKWTDKSRVRLKETLHAYARNLTEEKNLTAEKLTDELVQTVAFLWREALPQKESITLIGPLASWVRAVLGSTYPANVVGDEFFVTRSILRTQS